MKYQQLNRVALGSAIAVALLAGSANAGDIKFWTTEDQPERLARQQEMADQFKAATGDTVEVIPVSEKD